MAEFFPEVEISHEQAEAMARGLFAVAKADGQVHQREATLIADFFAESNEGAAHLAALERAPHLEGSILALALPGPELRRLFIKTALLLAHVDGDYSSAEAKQIGDYAKALGLPGSELGTLEQQVKEYLLGHLSHLHNVDAAVRAAKDLKL